MFFDRINFYNFSVHLHNKENPNDHRPSINLPKLYCATVRSDDIGSLMCDDCASEDINKQIKLLVKEFYPGFNFSNPNQRDIDNLL